MTDRDGSRVEEHLSVPRTARYWTLGPAAGPSEVWIVLHGYGQLAGEFVRFFAPIDDGTRLVVAPEALSRFYHQEGRGPVGASWMTREDREEEVTDYVRYLDLLYDRVFGGIDRDGVKLRVLGFSQGVAAAARWAVRGRATMDHLILWAGGFPSEVDPAEPRLHRLRTTVVAGTHDRIVAAAAMAQLETRLRGAGVPVDLREFGGGHRLDRELLRAIASE